MIWVLIFGFCVNYDKNVRRLNEMALMIYVMNAKYCMIDNNLFLVNDYWSLPVKTIVCHMSSLEGQNGSWDLSRSLYVMEELWSH